MCRYAPGQDRTAHVYQHGVEAASRIDAAVGDAASRAATLAASLTASVAEGGAHAATSAAARQLATQLDDFAKHPNPNHPDFFENLRK